MKFTVKTAVLKDMVSRAVKGAANNKSIPITCLMYVELQDGVLTFVTTDATNYLYIRERGIVGDDMQVTVPVETFTKFISRTTCDSITCELEENTLVIHGNGVYKIGLQMDDNTGEIIKFRSPLENAVFDPTQTITVNLSTIQVILNNLKPALSLVVDDPCYTGYYVGEESVLATDTYKIASLGVGGLFGKPKLISAEQMDLLSVMRSEKISVDSVDNIIVFGSDDCTVYGMSMENIDDYAVNAIMDLVNTDYDNVCKVSKSAVLQVLDRLVLFVNTFDKNSVYFNFTKDGLEICSKSANGVEIIPYIESDDFKPFYGCIDIEMLMSQIKAYSGENVEIHYGLDNAIKLVDGNVIHVIALMDDDRVG